MRKFFILAWLGFIPMLTYSQNSIDGLIHAEKSFAAYSLINGTKEAFLEFLDSGGIVFNEGKPVNGINFWSKQEKRPGFLNWRPQYAGISFAGDLGFTTGPWTFQQTLQDTIIARGSYMTVWHISKNGEWRFLVDLGVNNAPVNSDTSQMIFKNADEFSKKPVASLLATEKKFIERCGDPENDYKEHLSEHAIINRNGQLPDLFRGNVRSLPKTIQYTILGSGIASSGDLGYVYGSTVINGKTDNYLRIWRTEKAGWKIIAEVLRY